MGEGYVAVLKIEGNNPPYSFSSESGVPGLRMEDTGRIVGGPTEAGTFGAVVEVRDASGWASPTIVSHGLQQHPQTRAPTGQLLSRLRS